MSDLNQCLCVFAHLTALLEKFTKAIPDILQYPDPLTTHQPIKAVEILSAAFVVVLHEVKPFKHLSTDEIPAEVAPCATTLKELLQDFSAIHDELGKCLIPAGGKKEIFTLHDLAQKAIMRISDCTRPIHHKMLVDLEKEHGEQMAFAINPYKPWDAPPEPLTKLQEFLRESRNQVACCWTKKQKQKGD